MLPLLQAGEDPLHQGAAGDEQAVWAGLGNLEVPRAVQGEHPRPAAQ